jgi:transcriptional regulator with XRE-family HTH domain
VAQIGSRLRLARVQAGMTLRQAEEETGLSKDTISRIERGLRNPQPLTTAKLAEAYGHSIEEFLEDPKALASRSPTPEVPEERRNYRAEVETFIREASEVLDDPELMEDTCMAILQEAAILNHVIEGEHFVADPRTNAEGGYTMREFNDLGVAKRDIKQLLKRTQMVHRNKFGESRTAEIENFLKSLPGGRSAETG